MVQGGQRTEMFAADQPPLPAETGPATPGYHRHVDGSGSQPMRAESSPSKPWSSMLPTHGPARWFKTPEGRNWLDYHGFSTPPVYAPDKECSAGDPTPRNLAISIHDGDVITQPTVVVHGSASASDGIKSWTLEFGLGNDPNRWTTLAQGDQGVKNAPCPQLGSVQPAQSADHAASVRAGQERLHGRLRPLHAGAARADSD